MSERTHFRAVVAAAAFAAALPGWVLGQGNVGSAATVGGAAAIPGVAGAAASAGALPIQGAQLPTLPAPTSSMPVPLRAAVLEYLKQPEFQDPAKAAAVLAQRRPAGYAPEALAVLRRGVAFTPRSEYWQAAFPALGAEAARQVLWLRARILSKAGRDGAVAMDWAGLRLHATRRMDREASERAMHNALSQAKALLSGLALEAVDDREGASTRDGGSASPTDVVAESPVSVEAAGRLREAPIGLARYAPEGRKGSREPPLLEQVPAEPNQASLLGPLRSIPGVVGATVERRWGYDMGGNVVPIHGKDVHAVFDSPESLLAARWSLLRQRLRLFARARVVASVDPSVVARRYAELQSRYRDRLLAIPGVKGVTLERVWGLRGLATIAQPTGEKRFTVRFSSEAALASAREGVPKRLAAIRGLEEVSHYQVRLEVDP